MYIQAQYKKQKITTAVVEIEVVVVLGSWWYQKKPLLFSISSPRSPKSTSPDPGGSEKHSLQTTALNVEVLQVSNLALHLSLRSFSLDGLILPKSNNSCFSPNVMCVEGNK